MQGDRMAFAYEHDEQDMQEGLGTRIRNFFGQFSRHQGPDEAGADYTEPNRPFTSYSRGDHGSSRVRMTAVSQASITVMPASNFSDAQKAADRLKQGEPQIVNFERTSPEVSERLLDFLNGITYALDGYVERVGDRVYLFTPAHVEIHADAPEPPQQPRSFFDRH